MYEKEIIFNLKYKRKTYIAPIIAEIMYDRIEATGLEEYPDIIIPVPMHVTKERKRGFNQAALIAKELARLMGIEYRADIVMRCKSTGVMKRLSPEERLNNVRSAFEVYDGMRRKIFGENIFIVDVRALFVRSVLCGNPPNKRIRDVYFVHDRDEKT